MAQQVAINLTSPETKTLNITQPDATVAITVSSEGRTCNTANVSAAGALMDSEVDADIKTLSLPSNTTISTFGASLVDDANSTAARDTLGLGTLDTVTFSALNVSTTAYIVGGVQIDGTSGTASIDGGVASSFPTVSLPNATGTLALTSQADGGIVQADVDGLTTTETPSFAGINQLTSSAADPSISEYPNNKDWGIHKNTSSGIIYLSYNDNGSIFRAQLDALPI